MTSRRGDRSSHESGTREETDRLVPEDKEDHPAPPSPIRRRSATPPEVLNGRQLSSYRVPSGSRPEGDDDDDYVGVAYADSTKDNIGDRAGIILVRSEPFQNVQPLKSYREYITRLLCCHRFDSFASHG